MKTIEERCIDWGKERGLFDGDKINAWRAQFIKLLQEVHELEDAFISGDLEEVMSEAGDCLFVLNNLRHISEAHLKYSDNHSPSKKYALESALTMKAPLDTINYYDKIVCGLWWKAFSGIEEDGRVLTNRQTLLEKTLEKNEKRKGKTINNNFIKE